MSRSAGLRGSLALLALSLVFSAIAAEAVLRLLGHQGAPQSMLSNVRLVDDDILDWRYIPGSKVVEGRVVYRYNAAGFRDVDHATEKRPGAKRIVVVGDSVAEGRGVGWRQVFSAVLQHRLRGEYEVINLAQAGLNTPQEVHLFEEVGLAYEPDLVVLSFVLNDCDFYSRLKDARRYQGEKDGEIGVLGVRIDPRLKATLKSSALLYFVKDRLQDVRGMLLGVDQAEYHVAIWEHEENRKKVSESFDRLLALRDANSFELVIIIWPLLTEYSSYRYGSIHRWLSNEAERRGFAVIDLLPRFSAVSFRTLQVTAEDGVHPNGQGHALGAEAFLAWLQNRA